jgi:hypothetical protein
MNSVEQHSGVRSGRLALTLSVITLLGAAPVSAAVIVNTGGPYTFSLQGGTNNPFTIDGSGTFSTTTSPITYGWDLKGNFTFTDASTAVVNIASGYLGANISVGTAYNFCLRASDGSRASISCTTATAVASPSAVAEPGTWAMMIMGLGIVGFGLRSGRRPSARIHCA